MALKKHTPTAEKIKAIESYERGMSIEDIIEIYDIKLNAFYVWLRKFKKNHNYSDLENKHGGGPSKAISPYWEKRLLKMILKPATKYGFEDGLWSTKRIAWLINDKLNIKVSPITIWRLLTNNLFSYKSTEKNFIEGDEKELDEWLRNKFPKILKEVKKHRGILYFFDEANVKMTSNVGKTWSPIGERAVLKVTGKRGSISALSAISKSGYLLFNVYDGTIKSDDVVQFLEYMLEHHKRRHLFILLDNATVHHANKIKDLVEKNRRLHIEYLPKYWPKYNPDEFVWNYLKNVEMKSYSAKNTKALMKMVVKKLTKIAGNLNTILGIFMRCKLSYHME
jgi:transposase